MIVLLLQSPRTNGQQPKPKLKVGVAAIQDGPSPTFGREIEQLRTEVGMQLSDRFDVIWVELPEGDWTMAGVERQLDAVYSNPQVAVVVGFGQLAVRAVVARGALPKPTMLPFVVEAARQGLPRQGDVSGRRNLTYITADLDVTREVSRLREVAGSQRVVVLGDRSEEQLVSSVPREPGLTTATADPTVEALIAAIPKTADGVVIMPIPRLSLEDRERLMAWITRRRLPNVAVDPDWLEQGAMMSIRPSDGVLRRAQRAALNLDLILEGRSTGAIHVDLEERPELQINATAAAAIGVRPNFELLLEAELVGQEAVRNELLVSMEDVMFEAVDRNLDLLVSQKFVEAGEEGVKVDRGPLLPQGGLEAGAVARDPDRVPVGGQIAQRQASAYARASQSIFSAEAWARFKSRKLRQEGREYGYFVDVLDVMLGAGSAYVAVLRAQAQERIQRRNAQLTQEYLELARLRLEIGIANASELHRWQVTLAENRQSVVEARALIAQSKIDLNRLLNRPLEQPIAPLDLPDDPEGLAMPPDDPIAKYMRDPWSFEHLRDFMVAEGLRNSPAARQIEARKAALERTKKGLVQSLVVPDFFVEGGVQYDFWRNGKGAELPEQIPDELASAFPKPDKFGWDVGLYLAIPLSRGGSGVAAVRESSILVERFAAELARIDLSIGTGVRTELYSAGAALMNVSLTRQAASAAKKNLDLVVDLYRRGKVDIVRLVDAQTQSLVSNLAAANAVYDYVLSLLFVDREISYFRNLDTPEAKQNFARRLNEFMLRQQGR